MKERLRRPSTRHERREVCFLVGKGGAVLWSDASDSPVALPDSRARWEAIWSLREHLDVIAHAHPLGLSAFSAEDQSTMEALDSALGTSIRYMVVAPSVTIAKTGAAGTTEQVSPEPWWVALLRLASGMQKESR
ncbi:MAG TPA: hypothetical protein VL326_04640 [Kofleriaceae bacterium]|nr:hypothetical protein [Kofleriaceae bacterium]